MREPFIPASRQDLVDKLSGSERLSPEERTHFRQFCEILSAYAHFTGQKDLELMKLAFSNFDPNEDLPLRTLDSSARKETADAFADAFERTVLRANFRRLPNEDVHAALNKASIVPVRTAVDFAAFRALCIFLP